MTKSIIGVVAAVREGRFLYLLLTLLCYLLFTPYLQGFFRLRLLYYIFLTITLVAGILAIRVNRAQTVFAVGLAIPMIISIWIAYARPSPFWMLVTGVITLLFLIFITVSILHFVFTTQAVTHHVIFAAVSGYLLMGFTWSILYALLELLTPGAFSKAPTIPMAQPGFFIYFSFVTLTTLGYGDITPLTPEAEAMVVGEALIGQIYMTVLMAWLMGLYVSRKVSEASRKDSSG